MIIVDKPKLKFLLAGRAITVHTAREYRKGRTYAIGVRHNRTLCRAEILKATEVQDGWELEIRQAHDEKPRLLAARPGPGHDYVSDPHLAMLGEPEAVSRETQRGLSEQGTFRWRQEHDRRAAQRLNASLSERLARLEREQCRPGAADVSGELRVIRERLRKLRQEAA